MLRLLPRTTLIGGSIRLGGEDVMTMKPGRLRAVRWTGAPIVFQGALHSLNPVQRAGRQVEEAITLHGITGSRTKVAELFEHVGLPADRTRAYPHEMSGGQRQRRPHRLLALACEPTLLIADEPTTALDVMVQARVLQLLEQLVRDPQPGDGVHHARPLGAHLDVSAHRVMYAGRIVEDGPSEQVFANAEHPYSAALAAAPDDR